MKNTKEKLLKRFDRLSTQYTKCRDLEKMDRIYREMQRIVQELKWLES